MDRSSSAVAVGGTAGTPASMRKWAYLKAHVIIAGERIAKYQIQCDLKDGGASLPA